MTYSRNMLCGQAVADQLTGRLHHLDSKALAVLVYSCVKLKYSPTELLREVVDRVLEARPGWMSLKALVDLTWAFASSGCADSHALSPRYDPC